MQGRVEKGKRWQRAQSPLGVFWVQPSQPDWNCSRESTVCCSVVDAHCRAWCGWRNSRPASMLLFCTLTGAFLIPYVVFFICCGIPVFFLETALGQFTSEGGITCWRKVCPLFEGKC